MASVEIKKLLGCDSENPSNLSKYFISSSRLVTDPSNVKEVSNRKIEKHD
jgi:hypothetical protein